jgi:hypothetical protein
MRVLTTLVLSLSLTCGAHAASFWDKPQQGGNSFNRLPPDQAYFDALQQYGATWVRLSYDKWKPAKRDFLLGDADHYDGIPASDLAILRATLDVPTRRSSKSSSRLFRCLDALGSEQ